MKPTDYPSRKPLPVPKDDLTPKGKGPSRANLKGGIKTVDTPSFVHKQEVGPGKESTPGMPGVKTPKTKV